MTTQLEIRISGYEVKKLLADFVKRQFNITLSPWEIHTEICGPRQTKMRRGRADFVFKGDVVS